MYVGIPGVGQPADLPDAIVRMLNPPDEPAVFRDEDPEPLFGDLDFGLATQELTQSEVPAWLEGAEFLATLRAPEDTPVELQQLAQLSAGDASQAEVDSLTAQISPPVTAAPPGAGNMQAVLWIGFALAALVFGSRLATARGGRFGGGKAGW